ncbi:MAG TPA: signal peptide peptidase SppA [Candidatus Eisenbacteria bacterium]
MARRAALVLILLLAAMGAASLLAALRMRAPRTVTLSASALILDVPSTIDEAEPPPGPLSLGPPRRGRLTLYTLADAIERAGGDDHVAALVLHVGDLDWGWAKLAQVRDAIQRFAAHGKPVYASLSGGGEAEYLLASAARVVSMPPTATLGLDGLSAEVLFLRGTLDKLGVSPNMLHVGRYKSAVEGYTRTGLSVPAREALEAMLDDDYRLLVDSLASARRRTPDFFRRQLDDGPFTAREARARGLIDTLLYEPDLDSLAARRGRTRLATMPFRRYVERARREASHGTRVALITASGTIAPGRSRVGLEGEWILGSETLIEALQQARERRSIKGVVLRIDSPGGDAAASDEIWGAVERCRAKKPVVASFSDYAASGGYYIAMGADGIVSEPGTLTGSIGIYGGKMNVLGLLHKLGVSVERVSRGRHAGMLSPFSDFTPEEAQRFGHVLEEYYRGFVAKVAANRDLSRAQVDSVAQGRVWTGLAARQRGLVDQLGGFDEALAMLRDKAGLASDEELEVVRLPRTRVSFLQSLLEGLASQDEGEALERIEIVRTLRTLAAAASFPAGTALAHLPFTITIR